MRRIDLRSDTLTQPSKGMLAAMAAAETGDDVYGEDPTVNALQDRVAELLGKEAALFVPTGTMANLIAIMAQTRPGDSLILSDEAHPFHYEAGGMSRVGGVMPVTVSGAYGKLAPASIARAIEQTDDPHFSRTTLIAIENTSNRGGGACYTVEEVAAIGALVRARGLRLHCDGARLFNAAVALGVDAAALVDPCDSVSVCLSKGLGCPVGTVLAGDRAMIAEGLRCRKLLGGGMRQAGVIAAAGCYALEHHIADLAEDHRRAATFRAAMESEGVSFPVPTPTNIVYMHVAEPLATVSELASAGVLGLPHGGDAMRVVFHRDITDDDLEQAIAICRRVLQPAATAGAA